MKSLHTIRPVIDETLMQVSVGLIAQYPEMRFRVRNERLEYDYNGISNRWTQVFGIDMRHWVTAYNRMHAEDRDHYTEQFFARFES